MNTFSKTLGILALALMMPLTAGAAMAAQAPDTAFTTTQTTAATMKATGLVAKTIQPKTIEVAGRRGRGLALGIIAGVATAAIVSGAARAHHRDHYSYRGHRHTRHCNHRNYSRARYVDRCDRWAYRCDEGFRRACRKYYRHCD